MTSGAGPDSAAVRVALWRALHVRLDAPPHVLEDEIGLKLAAPEPGWEKRGDMDPERTRRFRAGIVARSRFIEETVAERAAQGAAQYVLLGAGLDTFAQREPELASRLIVYEVDRAGPQEWKRRRLIQLGCGVPDNLRLVPVDFEGGDDWLERLSAAGFDAKRPAVVASAGVSMYLTKEANAGVLRRAASLAPGSALLMTCLRPPERLDAEDRPAYEGAIKGARAVTSEDYVERYFRGRADGLRPSSGEDLLVADA